MRKRAVEPLLARLEDPDEHVRGATVYGLGHLGDSRAVEALIPRLRDDDEDMRAAAAHSLGRLAASRAVEALIAVLEDEDRRVRETAAWALARIGTEEARRAVTDAGWDYEALRDADDPIHYCGPVPAARARPLRAGTGEQAGL